MASGLRSFNISINGTWGQRDKGVWPEIRTLSSPNLLLRQFVFCSPHARDWRVARALDLSSLVLGFPQCYHIREVKVTMLLQKHRNKQGTSTGCCPNPTTGTL